MDRGSLFAFVSDDVLFMVTIYFRLLLISDDLFLIAFLCFFETNDL